MAFRTRLGCRYLARSAKFGGNERLEFAHLTGRGREARGESGVISLSKHTVDCIRMQAKCLLAMILTVFGLSLPRNHPVI